MIANVSKNNTGKLLVAVMAMVMIAVSCAVVISDETNAATSVSDYDELVTALENKETEITATGAINLEKEIDLTGVTLDLGENGLQTNGYTITGGTITGTAKQIIYPLAYSTSVFKGVTITGGDSTVYAMYAWNASVELDDCTITGGTIGFDNATDGNTLTLINGTIVEGVAYISSAGSTEYVVGEDVIMDSTSRIVNTNIGYPTEDTYDNQTGGVSTITVPEKQPYNTDEVTAGKNNGGQSDEKPLMTVEPGAEYNGPNNDLVNNEDTERMPLSQNIIAVYDELPISGTAYIAGTNSQLVIPEGKTLRIMSGGELDMSRNTLIVEGTLIIETGATVSNGGTIVLTRGGTFDNSGIIGAGTATTITAVLPSGYTTTPAYTGVGSVTVSNVSGMTFGFVNTTGTNQTPQYTLTVTGDLIAEGTSANSISINGARITGELYIGQDVDLEIDSAEIRSGVSIVVDGTLTSNGNLKMYNGSEIVVNGQIVGAVKAVTGDYASNIGETGFVSSNVENKETTFAVSATGGFVSGYTLSVGTYGYQKEVSEGEMEAWTAQRLYLDGSLAYGTEYTNPVMPTSGTMTIGGNGITVAADVTVVLPSGMTVNNAGSPVTVLGTVQMTGATTVPAWDYVGSAYIVKTTGTPSTSTGYITTFSNAMGAIATADQQKVTVKGNLDIDAEYTLLANQRLDISNAGDVVVKDGGSLTLEARSILTGVVDDVQGVMTIMKPNGSSAPAKYSTISEGTTSDGVNYTRYSGLQYALDNATSGETITVVGETEVDGNLTIPAGITVSGENKISISGNLVIEETAKLEMVDNYALDMTGAKSKVTVNGELDLTEGQITFTSKEATTDTALTSTVGTTKWSLTQDIEGNDLPDAFNAVGYMNENNQIIMTSAEAAIAAATAQDINKYVLASGNVTAGDIELTVDMLVRMDANVTFGTVTLAEGVSILVNDEGRLTASVSAQTGVEGSESLSTVVLDGVANIAVGEVDVIDSQNVTTHQLYIAGVPTGSVTVSAGTAVVGNNTTSIMGFSENYKSLKFDATVDSASTLTVAAGATLQVNNGMTLIAGDNGTNNDQPAVIVNGTLAVAESGIVTVTGVMDVAGDMTVADNNTTGVTVSGTLNVTGTLDISATEDEAASIEVSGTLVVGEKITTMGGSTAGAVIGEVAFDNKKNGSVKVYNGASVDDAIIGGDANGDGVSDAKHTAFYINGNLYMTVYATSENIDDTYLQDEDISLTGYDMKVSNAYGDVYDVDVLDYWYKDADMTQQFGSSGTATVGSPEAIYFKVNASNVDVKVSVGSGISLYIDNVRYSSGETISLAVGTHTVTAAVNPGYTGNVTVQFNGQTVSGEFTITPEMASNTYEGTLTITATGDITQDSTVVVDGGSSGDSGMSLTDILLIVLVVLILVMAIIVALRLMRS